MKVVLVDWLGRGGIAQCTEAWALELRRHGHDIDVVAPGGREIEVQLREVEPARTRLERHISLMRTARDRIDRNDVDVLVLNNYVLPLLERRLARHAAKRDTRVIQVVHNARPHSRFAGSAFGLQDLIKLADVVVTHSDHERQRLYEASGVESTVVSHPMQIGMLSAGDLRARPVPTAPVACQFGVLKRRYKGRSTLVELANAHHEPWCLRAAGVGAPSHPEIETVAGFLSPDQLVSFVAESAVALFPYRRATQSGGVVLAKALGVIPVATSVGALPEQIDDGHSGLLVDPAAPVSEWLRVLRPLLDLEVRRRMSDAARASAAEGHRQFVRAIIQLVDPGLDRPR